MCIRLFRWGADVHANAHNAQTCIFLATMMHIFAYSELSVFFWCMEIRSSLIIISSFQGNLGDRRSTDNFFTDSTTAAKRAGVLRVPNAHLSAHSGCYFEFIGNSAQPFNSLSGWPVSPGLLLHFEQNFRGEYLHRSWHSVSGVASGGRRGRPPRAPLSRGGIFG